MASTKLEHTKDGKPYYRVAISRGRSQPPIIKRWYPEKSWSQRTIDRELAKYCANLENAAKSGELLSHKEANALAAQQAEEKSQILTLERYSREVFMPSITIRVSENTRSSYQMNLDHWILPAMGNLKLPDITSANISALLLKMQAQGKAQGTCIKCYTVLSSLFKQAYSTDLIERNPMDKVQRPQRRKDEVVKDVDSYTAEEVREILMALENEPLKWRTYIRLLLDMGCRRGELCGIQWTDIDFAANTITIQRNLCYTPEQGIFADTTKTGRIRTVDVDPAIMPLLREYKANQEILSKWVFTQDGTADPMHPTSPTRYFRKFGERYGIKDFHPHKLRHTFASLSITAGADIASVSEKLGHQDKSTTLRLYTHADQESMRKASNIFRETIKQGG